MERAATTAALMRSQHLGEVRAFRALATALPTQMLRNRPFVRRRGGHARMGVWELGTETCGKLVLSDVGNWYSAAWEVGTAMTGRWL